MSKKLTFKEWEQKQDGSCNKNFDACSKSCLSCGHDSNPANAWHFCQAQEHQEISELKNKVEELSKVRDFLESELSIALGAFSKTEKERLELEKKVEELEDKLEKADKVIWFYANQENWYSHGKDSTIKRRIDLNDGEEFLNYEYGGKRARAYLKENEL